MKKVVVLQSNYIPWKGYFDLIHDADHFIFYDDVQFTKNDWRNRNKIKTAQGSHWLSVPVGIGNDRLICDVEIVSDAWQKKHWETIKQNYSKCAHFSKFADFFEDFYLDRKWTNLSEMNQYLIQRVSREFLGITAEYSDSREYELTGAKVERLLELIRLVGATHYVSGPAAKSYCDESAFRSLNVELIWKDYSGYKEYPQRHPPFDHHVSIIDLLFNVGDDAPSFIWDGRSDLQIG